MGKKKLQGADGMNFQLQLTIKGLESINLPEENLTNESGNDIMKISCWGGKLSAYVNLPNAIRPNNVQPFQLSDCIKIELVRNQVIEHMRSYLQKHLKDKYSDEFLSMMSVTKMECNLTIKCVGDCKPKDVIRLFERSFANKLVKNLTYSVNQSATPKQQEREAKKYAMDMEDKLKYGYDYNAEKMSFEDFAYKWLESVKDNIAYGTYAGYKQVLESRIIPYFKGDKIAHIKTPHIEAFYRTLVDDYSAGTIKRFANVLNLIFKTAKRYSMIENNPCQDAQKPKRKDEDEGLKFFTPKQALMFMKSLDMSYEVTYKGHQRIDDTGKPYYVNEYTESYTVPTQYKVFFTLSLFCGFRKGETLALHWNDIDFKEKKISISKSVGMTENGFDYKEPKTKKSVRKVSIPDDVIPLLKQYHFEYIQTRFSHGTAWQGDLSNGGNLFIQADGKLMGHTTPYQYFTKHLHRYNEWVQNNPDKAKAEGLEELPIIPLHGLRHSCATLLNYLEVNIIEISKTLGHSTCSTTMNIYAHSFEEQQEEVATKVNEFLRLNA